VDIKIKRAYDPPEEDDGFRVLIDRLWPRGVSKEAAKIDLWSKDLSPSTALRRWFGHDPKKWEEFKRRYYRELDAHPEAVEDLRRRTKKQTVTLIFGAKDPGHSNARALMDYLKKNQ
jgi:uncharacterized protein YeaO (DUF488 family)